MKNDLPVIRFHDLRHSHASLLHVSAAADAKTVQERLGHSSIVTTMDIYTHTNLSTQVEAIKRLEEVLL